MAEILGAASVPSVAVSTRRDFLGAARRVSMRWVRYWRALIARVFDRFFERGIRVEEIGIGFGEERDSGELTVGKSHVMDCFTTNGTRVSSFALVLDVDHK